MVTACNFAQQPFLVNLNRVKYVVLCLKSSPNLVTVEIRPIHVVWINLNAILVHEKLSQHRLLASNTYWRCRGCCACFDEHTFFKALSLVLASSVTAVLDNNSPECHNTFVLMWILWDYSESRYFSIAWMRSFKSLTFSSLLSWYFSRWQKLKLCC